MTYLVMEDEGELDVVFKEKDEQSNVEGQIHVRKRSVEHKVTVEVKFLNQTSRRPAVS